MRNGLKKSLKKRMNGSNKNIFFPGNQSGKGLKMHNDIDMSIDDSLYQIKPNIIVLFISVLVMVVVVICYPFIRLVSWFKRFKGYLKSYIESIKQRNNKSKDSVQKGSTYSILSKPRETHSSSQHRNQQVRSVNYEKQGIDHVS